MRHLPFSTGLARRILALYYASLSLSVFSFPPSFSHIILCTTYARCYSRPAFRSHLLSQREQNTCKLAPPPVNLISLLVHAYTDTKTRHVTCLLTHSFALTFLCCFSDTLFTVLPYVYMSYFLNMKIYSRYVVQLYMLYILLFHFSLFQILEECEIGEKESYN